MKLVVTGGAGFIGSAFVRLALSEGHEVLVYDALTYAGHTENLEEVEAHPGFSFVLGNICDGVQFRDILAKFKPHAVLNFAAESHVDNSISGPRPFLETNILGTFEVLQTCRDYLSKIEKSEALKFRFVQVSTDEVFGQLGHEGYFSESSPYQPNSPYSASKASSDFLVRAWHHTYGLPTIITNCSNNYGPRQFPEKLIPLMIQNCLNGKALPVYGKGQNVRDWIHVEDHCRGVLLALEKGRVGETYCFGGASERTNLQVVHSICKLMDEMNPSAFSHESLISFVADRAGHDWRYAIDDRKASEELGFQRTYQSFDAGLKATVLWYLRNQRWVQRVSRAKERL